MCQTVDLVGVFSCDIKTDQGSLTGEAERLRKVSIRAALTPVMDRLDEAGSVHLSPLLISVLASVWFFLGLFCGVFFP